MHLVNPFLCHLCAFCFLRRNSCILSPKQKISVIGLEAVGGRKRRDQTITPPTAAAASAALPRFRQPPPAWWCQQVARHRVGCCEEGLHCGRLGNDESLGGRRRCNGSHGGDNSMMVGWRWQRQQQSAWHFCGMTEDPPNDSDVKALAVRATDCQQRLPWEAVRVGGGGWQRQPTRAGGQWQQTTRVVV